MLRLFRAIARAAAGLALLFLLMIAIALGATALWVNRLTARAADQYPPIGQLLTVDGARLHYIEAGTASAGAPTLVLIHGNPGTVRDFERLVPLLAIDHRVIAVDRPGHGYSERPDMAAASPAAQARQLHAALERIGVRRPILIGHSWGGALALAYAIEFPNDVSGLTLLGTRAYPATGSPDPLYTLVRRPVIGPVLRYTIMPLVGRRLLEGRMRDAYRPDPVERGPLAVARALWMRPGQLGATVWDTFLLQRDAGAMARRFSSISVPVMLLAGDADRLLPETQQLSTDLPDAWIEVLPNTGHNLPRTRVAEIQHAIAVLEARMRGSPSSPRASGDSSLDRAR